MDKQKLQAALKRHTQGAEVITKQQICSFMGIKKQDHIRKYTDGLQALDGKYYLISEIADRMMQRAR